MNGKQMLFAAGGKRGWWMVNGGWTCVIVWVSNIYWVWICQILHSRTTRNPFYYSFWMQPCFAGPSTI